MKPKEIARLISEDPDVLNEAYCPECGGSDDDPFTDPTARGWGGKVMRGHRYNCPTGAPMGSPIIGQIVSLFDWDKFVHKLESDGFEEEDFEDEEIRGGSVGRSAVLVATLPTKFELTPELEEALADRAEKEAAKIGMEEYESSTEPDYHGKFKELYVMIDWEKTRAIKVHDVPPKYRDDPKYHEIEIEMEVPYETKGWRTNSIL